MGGSMDSQGVGAGISEEKVAAEVIGDGEREAGTLRVVEGDQSVRQGLLSLRVQNEAEGTEHIRGDAVEVGEDKDREDGDGVGRGIQIGVQRGG